MTFKISKFSRVLLLVALVALAACSKEKPKSATPPDLPVGVTYNRGLDEIISGDYTKATKDFDLVEQQHPYSEWATRAELMSAYASYKAGKYEEAQNGLDRYTEMHPGNKDIDYALYLRALSYYDQIGDVARDQANTDKALDGFNALIQRFPDSRYTRDATIKRDLTLDHLAGKQMEIGRYYLNRNQIQAAINRFLKVVKDYQTTTHVPEALERLVECYTTLGLTDQATKVAAVLGYNYPGSKWYARAYGLLDARQRQQLISDQGRVKRTVDSIFRPD